MGKKLKNEIDKNVLNGHFGHIIIKETKINAGNKYYLKS